MDDRRAHFLHLVGEASAAAQLGAFEVELAMVDGTRVRGIPTAPAPGEADDAVDDTGFQSAFEVDGTTVHLERIAAFTVFAA